MKKFSIVPAAAALLGFLAIAPSAQAQPACAPTKAQLGNWKSERNAPDFPPRWSTKVYCQNGREGEVVKIEGDDHMFMVQVNQFNKTGIVFDPGCSFAVDAYCSN